MVDGFLAFKWWEFFKHFAKKEEKKYVLRKIDTLPVSRFARSVAEKCKNVTKHKKVQ